MTKTLEFLFDIVSPASHLAWPIVPKIAASAGAELIYTPVLLGGVMQATGNRPPGTVAAKGRWMGQDLARWAGHYGVTYRRNDVFPQMTIMPMRGALALLGTPGFMPFVEAFLKALHVDNLVVEDEAVIGGVLEGLGLDPSDMLARTQDPAIKERLKTNTEDAVARGMFGAPTFFIGETMHFGQDRLWMVAEDLGVDLRDVLAA